MLIRVNEKMDNLLKKIEKSSGHKELQVLSLLVTAEVYEQWKDKEIKVITHDQKMEMQRGEVEDEWNN